MKKIFYYFYLVLAFWPMVTIAGPLEGLEQAAAGTGLGNRDIVTMVSFVINSLLALLGTAFMVFILIGGFKWMTSQGNTQKVDDARKTITSAATGLAIVLMSYAIARFVILAFTRGTGGSSSMSG